MMQRHFVVRFKRHGARNPELRWLSPEPAEEVVVAAENVPMAVRQFYREHAQDDASLTLLEIFEKKEGNSPPLPDAEFFRRE
ncbi:MAG: hypothetical protein AB1413_05130 [Thermodesulfobacteriota bacterium]